MLLAVRRAGANWRNVRGSFCENNMKGYDPSVIKERDDGVFALDVPCGRVYLGPTASMIYDAEIRIGVRSDNRCLCWGCADFVQV